MINFSMRKGFLELNRILPPPSNLEIWTQAEVNLPEFAIENHHFEGAVCETVWGRSWVQEISNRTH